jgi:UDP-N-acetylglucosamine diphosphorylase/glucosamine-1-phosphate N-acetyltransferase
MKAKNALSAIVLAAGKGTRMKSDLAKVLHPVCGRPMLHYSLAVARSVGARKIVCVIGHQADDIRRRFDDPGLIFVEQSEQLGTGHAVLQAREAFAGDDGGTVLILCGDVPLLRRETVEALLARHAAAGAAVTVMTTLLADPGHYGRVVTDAAGRVVKSVEARDATPAEREIREINTGIYCVEAGFLFEAVAGIGNNNAQGEYYLTDIVEMAHRRGLAVRSYVAANSEEVMGINTPAELARACRLMEAGAGATPVARSPEGAGKACTE